MINGQSHSARLHATGDGNGLTRVSEFPKSGHEQEIYERLKAGDMSACKECVETHSDGLYRLAYRMLHNEAAAEDVVQDTFLNAFKGLDQFDGRSTLGTWLFRIAYNNALMHLRSEKPTYALADEEDETAEELHPVVVAWRETPEDVVTQAEASATLEAAIESLPPTLGLVFQLRDLEERSTAETAEILGLSEAAVKVRLHRARLSMREKLSDYFGTATPAVPATMTCDELTRYLSDYIDKDLDEPLAKAAQEHLATCTHCHILLDTTRRTITLMREPAPRVVPAADRARLFERIQAAFAERNRPASQPNKKESRD